MLSLEHGSRIAVVGGGPAGAFFSYFLLEMAERAELALDVDIYEPRDFHRPAPAGCNMCGGIVSESLVQILSAEGISLPPTVVQRGIDAYVLHTDVGRVKVQRPLPEMRIGTVHRGGGPRDVEDPRWSSFDGHVLDLACARGAKLIRARVEDLSWDDKRPRVHAAGRAAQTYDLLVGAVGVNTGALKLFEKLDFGFRAPKTTRAFIAEFHLGQDVVSRHLGNAMHVFLVNLPRLEFAALVPKGDYVTMCLLGREIDGVLVEQFLHHPEVRACFPLGWEEPVMACHCTPRMYIEEAVHPFGDRVVLIGDCSASRLYKNGLGAAYRTAKSCAVTALFNGISAKDFEMNYWRTCQRIIRDNKFGRGVFGAVSIFKRAPFITLAMINMTRSEDRKLPYHRDMSVVLWNTFTGSADYKNIVLRAMRPWFIATFAVQMARALVTWARFGQRVRSVSTNADVEPDYRRISESLRAAGRARPSPRMGELGKIYSDGETIVRKGDVSDRMYVVLAGEAKVYASGADGEIWLRNLGPGDTFGESAMFRRMPRSATVRADGEARVLSLNRRQFLSTVREDPTFEFRILEQMASRVRQLTDEVVRLNTLVAHPVGSADGAAHPERVAVNR